MTRLGINTGFAVKRWPRPGDWAPIVRDELGLGFVQVSLDLVDVTRDATRSPVTWTSISRLLIATVGLAPGAPDLLR